MIETGDKNTDVLPSHRKNIWDENLQIHVLYVNNTNRNLLSIPFTFRSLFIVSSFIFPEKYKKIAQLLTKNNKGIQSQNDVLQWA